MSASETIIVCHKDLNSIINASHFTQACENCNNSTTSTMQANRSALSTHRKKLSHTRSDSKTQPTAATKSVDHIDQPLLSASE